MTCIFCDIIAGKAPAFVIEEDDQLIVAVSLENHPLVITRAHHVNLLDLPDALAAAVMIKAKRIAHATKQALQADGIYITQTNGAAAGQDVFHYHLHVYPKWADGRQLPRDPASRQATRDAIRRSLASM